MKQNNLFSRAFSSNFLCGILLFSTVLSTAQNTRSGEQVEDAVVSISKQIAQKLRTQEGINKEDVVAFSAYNSELIGSDRGNLFKNVEDGGINNANTSTYINSMVSKYAALYEQFKKLSPEDRTVHSIDAVSPPWPGACNSSCTNIDFENGTLSGWMACYSNVTTATTSGPFTIATPTCSGILGNVTSAAIYPSTNLPQVQITSASSGNDPVCGAFIPQLCPFGGNYSVEIGDYNNPNYGVGILEQSFNVTPTNCGLTYNYAVVLENPPGHGHYGQPYFQVSIYDQNGNAIPSCGSNMVTGDSAYSQGNFKGFYYAADGDTCYCRPWTGVFVSLKRYIGQCVTIKVLAADCYAGGHFGYAYFDAHCAPLTITSSSPTVCGGPITLTGPTGAASYKWIAPGGACMTPAAGNTQSINITCSGKYSVIVKSLMGGTCADTLDTIIASSVGNPPVPNFKSDTVCLGMPTQFTNLTTGAGNTYKWIFGDPGSGVNDSSTSTNPTHTYLFAGNYTATLSAVNGSCGHDTAIKVVITPIPALTITSSPKNDTVCTGGIITLTGSGATSYAWSGGISNGVAFSPSSSGKYVVTGTTYGCSAKDSVNIVTSTKALPTITVASSPTNDSVCNGSPVTLTASGGKTYSWSGGITNAVAFTPATSSAYIVTGTDANGCSNRDTVKVAVIKPTLGVVSAPVNATVCKGSSVTLTASGAVSYTWSGGITNAVAFTPAASGSYIVTGTDKKGCKNTDTAKVTVNPTPTIIITSSPKNDTVCTGGNITLSGNGGVSYTWSNGITNAVAFSPSSSGKYVVTGTDANGCMNKDSVNIVAGTGALPTITATSLPASDTICKGSTITLSGNGGAYYNWSGGINNGVAFSPSSSGKYVVTGTNNTGCSNTDTVKVVVKTLPAITITGQINILSGTPDTLVAGGGGTYVWNTGGTKDSLIVAPTTKTVYTVTVTGSNGCSDTASFTVNILVTTSVNNIKNVNGVNLYPNPATEILNIEFNTNARVMPVVIKINDIAGKQIVEVKKNLSGNTTLPINISSLAAGMYFVRIETGTDVQVVKFIKK
jgi:hypothetical protein